MALAAVAVLLTSCETTDAFPDRPVEFAGDGSQPECARGFPYQHVWGGPLDDEHAAVHPVWDDPRYDDRVRLQAGGLSLDLRLAGDAEHPGDEVQVGVSPEVFRILNRSGAEEWEICLYR